MAVIKQLMIDGISLAVSTEGSVPSEILHHFDYYSKDESFWNDVTVDDVILILFAYANKSKNLTLLQCFPKRFPQNTRVPQNIFRVSASNRRINT